MCNIDVTIAFQIGEAAEGVQLDPAGLRGRHGVPEAGGVLPVPPQPECQIRRVTH